MSNPDAQTDAFEGTSVSATSVSRDGDVATIEEVANIIAYACSPAASATSGPALRVDGGVVRAIP